jgi:hypothetical protein
MKGLVRVLTLGAVLAPVALGWAADAPQSVSTGGAVGAPVVNGNSGDLAYEYRFDLPKARGRYQPSLSLVYSSASARDTGFGIGWSLTATYLEWDRRSSPGVSSLWLVRGTDRKLMVPFGSGYRPEVEDSFFEVTAATGGFTAKDAAGNAYVFDRAFGNRYSLTKVTDLDGNVTELGYDPSIPEPTTIRYNRSIIDTSLFGTVVALEFTEPQLNSLNNYVPAKPPTAANDAGGLVPNDKRLTRVRIKGASDASNSRTIRGYELKYTPPVAGDATGLAQITQFGLDFASALPPTSFGYQLPGPSRRSPLSELRRWIPAGTAWRSRQWALRGDPRGPTSTGTVAQTSSRNGELRPRSSGTGTQPRSARARYRSRRFRSCPSRPMVSWMTSTVMVASTSS